MQKRLFGTLIILLSFFLPAFASSGSSCPNLTLALARGSRGSDVILLQKFLISEGLLESDSATGYFGALTEAAVKSFQAKNDIVSSGNASSSGYGVVGPRTRALIASRCNIKPAVSASVSTISTIASTTQKHACQSYQNIFCSVGQHIEIGALDNYGCASAPHCIIDSVSSTTTLSRSLAITVGGRDTYIDAKACYEKYYLDYGLYGLPVDYIVACAVTPITYSGGSAYFVDLSVGPGMDCPSGCIYNHSAYILAKGSAYSVPSVHAVGRQEVGEAVQRKLGIEVARAVSSIFFSDGAKRDSSAEPKYLPTLIFDGANPVLRYVFGSSEIVQGTYDVHSDGAVTEFTQSQSTVLSRDQAIQIAKSRLAQAPGFTGYSFSTGGGIYDYNNRSWLFDAASYPLRGDNMSKPVCMINVYSESKVEMACVPGSQTSTDWSKVLFKPIEQVKFTDY